MTPFRFIALLAALLVTGCGGQTNPASDVTPTGAKLNGNGVTGDVPASVFFEYWRTADPGNVRSTDPVTIPAHSSGDFSRTVGDLTTNAGYSFRLSGKDDGAAKAACANRRTFVPSGDVVRAIANTDPSFGGEEEAFGNIGIVARGSPDGSHASGRVQFVWYSYCLPCLQGIAYGSATEQNVTCVHVSGNDAVIGFRIRPNGNTYQVFAEATDGGPGGADTFTATIPYSSRDPTDCSPLGLHGDRVTSGNIVIDHAAP